LSSPDEIKLREIRKGNRTVRMYIPLWNLAELKKIRSFHEVDGRIPSVDFIKSRFDEFGGVPRTIFDPEAEEKLNPAIAKVDLSELKSFFDQSAKGNILPIIIHMKPTETLKDFLYVVASKAIEKRLLARFSLSLKNDLDWWLSAARGDGDLAQTRGKLKEHQWHRRVLKGGKFNARKLGSHMKPLNAEDVEMIEIPEMEEIPFSSLVDLTELQPSCYYRPTTSNFKTFDSFAILDYRLFKRNGRGKCAVAFQMTVARLHRLNIDGIKALEEALERLGHGEIPILIIFITETTGVTTAQKVSSKGTPYVKMSALPECKIPQYAFVT